MIEYTINDVIKKLVLIITISIAIAGTMLASEIMFSKKKATYSNSKRRFKP